MAQKAAFFDRDGVINEDKNYVHSIENFVFCDGIFKLLELAKQKNYLLLVVTNQSGIGRGLYTQEDLESLHKYMQQELIKKLGFGFDRIYFCPHSPELNCECRKPKIGMINQALSEFDIDLARSFLIGDKITDMQCAKSADIAKRLFLSESSDEIKDIQLQKITSLHQAYSIIDSFSD